MSALKPSAATSDRMRRACVSLRSSFHLSEPHLEVFIAEDICRSEQHLLHSVVDGRKASDLRDGDDQGGIHARRKLGVKLSGIAGWKGFDESGLALVTVPSAGLLEPVRQLHEGKLLLAASLCGLRVERDP